MYIRCFALMCESERNTFIRNICFRNVYAYKFLSKKTYFHKEEIEDVYNLFFVYLSEKMNAENKNDNNQLESFAFNVNKELN